MLIKGVYIFRKKSLQYMLLACLMGITHVAQSQESFDVWLMAVQDEAIARGVSSETTQKAAQKIQYLPNIIALDRAQPEFITTFLDYYQRHVNAHLVQQGQLKLQQFAKPLEALEAKYGIPQAYLIAFWGMETHYGQDKGQVDVLSSLATLSYEGRRAHFFRQQLIDALQIADTKKNLLSDWQGSWAGAFGHMQFMPSTFKAYATDGDADGEVDLVHSEVDALTSAAHYLSQVGWQRAQPVAIEVQLPANFAMQEAQFHHKKTVATWMALGVKAVDGKIMLQKKSKKMGKNRKKSILSHKSAGTFVQADAKPLSHWVADTNIEAAILLPQGARGPAFMVFENFRTVMDWNRSVSYALSVAQLAREMQAHAPVLGGQTAENGALSFVQVQQLQIMLNDLGFDAGEPDGFPGLQTQAAIRAYQQVQEMPADGYASPSLYHVLNQKNMEISVPD